MNPERLREVAFAAKAHWGYDEQRVHDWADSIDFDDGRIVFVEGDVAWASVIPQGDLCVLEDLWVDPPAMGRGVGTKLFQRAAEHARMLGATRMEWEAEPNAVGFYEKLGGRHLRDSEPSEWGRVLSVMGVSLVE
ncbi:MAG TPA: GNAT family N-acetyltransferase [Gaiellaceae bacterium]|nr:GNAT family N-acetyltransferase [Gaiellaceae bacterium]